MYLIIQLSISDDRWYGHGMVEKADQFPIFLYGHNPSRLGVFTGREQSNEVLPAGKLRSCTS